MLKCGFEMLHLPDQWEPLPFLRMEVPGLLFLDWGWPHVHSHLPSQQFREIGRGKCAQSALCPVHPNEHNEAISSKENGELDPYIILSM